MPSDRGSSSILQNTDWSKYQTLSKFIGSSGDSTSPASTDDSQLQALNVLEQVLDETEALREPSVIDQVLPQAVENTFVEAEEAETASQVAQAVGSRQKETIKNPVAVETPVVEDSVSSESVSASETAPQAEQASNPEIAELSQEIKEIGQETKEQREQAEIQKQQAEINNLATAAKQTPVAVDPVVVLPVTENTMQEGQRKGTKFSLRWLTEWAEKISKMFSGAVLYKEEAISETDI